MESGGQRNKESKSSSIIVEFSVSLSHTHSPYNPLLMFPASVRVDGRAEMGKLEL